jgi:two-component system NtrC family sensor kinase
LYLFGTEQQAKRMKRLILCGCIFLNFLSPGFSSTSADSIRIEEMLLQVGQLCTTKPDSALQLANQCLQLAQKIDHALLLSRTHYLQGVAWKNKSDFEAAETAYQQAAEVALSIPDSLQAAEGWYGLGNLKRHQGEYAASLELLNKALQTCRRNNAAPTTIARTYNAMGNVLYTIGDTPAAIEKFRQSMMIHQGIPANTRFVASTQINIGGMFVDQGQPDSALQYLIPALNYYQRKENPRGVGAAAINLAEVYLLLAETSEALQYADMAQQNFAAAQDLARQGMALNTLAKIAAQEQDYPRAIRYASQSLEIAEQVQRPDNIRDQRHYLAELFAQNGDWQQAYQLQVAYEQLKDSLFNERIDAQMARAQQEMEVFVKDQEISNLKAEQQRQQRRRSWLISILLLSVLFLAFLFWINRKRRLALQQLQAEQMQTKRLLSEKELLLSDLKRTQLKLIESEKMISLGQLTAGIAHEINNPINFVMANLSALRLDFEDILPLLQSIRQLKLSDDQTGVLAKLIEKSEQIDLPMLEHEIRALLDSIDSGAERTHEIVKSLGAFSRNTSEHFLPANLNEGIDNTLMLIRGSLPERVEVKTNYGELPPVVCQITRLNQVFLNLLNNAVQAIEGSGTIHILTRQLDETNVEVQIRDTGNGMDAQTKQRIFEPFFTTKSVGEGTGLGLSISYGIIKQHQGQIEVDSKPGEGATFRIILPIHQSTDA